MKNPVVWRLHAILAAALAAPLAAGCLAPNSIKCSDGIICPVGTGCDVVTHTCATAGQLAACGPLGEGADCMVGGRTGVCRSGVCTQFKCGDGVIDEGEQCDGSELGGATCQKQGFYGGSLACSSLCSLDVSGCSGYCGDGVVNGPEICDGAAPDPSRLSCLDYGWDRGTLGCSAACQESSSGCVKFGLTTLEAPPAAAPPAAQSLDGVWASGPNDVWVFGNDTPRGVGFLWRYDGTGWSWRGRSRFVQYQAIGGSGPDDVFIALTLPAPYERLTFDHGAGPEITFDVFTLMPALSIQAIWGSSHDDAFAVGDRILHWDGKTWSTVAVDQVGTPQDPETFSSVWGSGAMDVFVASTYGRVLHSDGMVWTVNRAGADHAVGAAHLSGNGRDNVYLVAGPSIFHWDGVDWTALDTAAMPSAPVGAWGGGADDSFAILGDGTFVHWDATGRTTLKAGDVRYEVRAVSNNGGEAFAAGHDAHAPDGAYLLMRWDGNGWFPIAGDPPVGIDLSALWGAGERDLYALGRAADGTTVIAHWDGRGWATVADSLPRLVRIWGTAAGDLYAAGQGLFHWKNGTTATEVVAGDFSGVSGTGANDVFAWGPAGISHWDGSGWTTTDGSVGVVNDVWGSRRGNAFAVGQGGAIARWNGARWSPMASGTTDELRRVWGRGSTDVFAAGARGRILHWDGSVWAAMPTPVARDFVYIGGDGGGDVFAATDSQLVHLLSGVWERVAIPDVGVARDLWATPTRLFVLGSGGRAYLNRASVTCAGPERDCHDGWDNDCDGLQDGDDPDCKVPEQCDNYVDDDGDGAVDCADSDCAAFSSCLSP